MLSDDKTNSSCALTGALFGAIPFAANTTHGGLVTQFGAARLDGTACPAVLAYVSSRFQPAGAVAARR